MNKISAGHSRIEERGSDRDKVWTNMNVIIGSIASASLLHFLQLLIIILSNRLSYAVNVVVVVVFVTTVRTITILSIPFNNMKVTYHSYYY